MDFATEPSKTSASFMEPNDPTFSYMESGLEFIQYPQSPSFGVSMTLPGPSGSPAIGFNSLNLSNGLGDYTYSSPAAYGAAGSPARPYTPPDGASISPPSLTYNLSAGELSSDGMASGRRSRGSGTHSPSNASFPSSVPRSHRFNPMASPATRPIHRRKNSRANDDSDEEDDDFQPIVPNSSADSRRETIRKQRIESEQRRRDELRDGYARLKDTLPPSNQKASKVSLLDRATNHLRYLETIKDQLENRLKAAEAEVHRLRSVNEALMLGTAGQRHNGVATTMVPTASF
ncbi:BHLH domain-containing protein [Pleurotus pulmonarius]|nr:hypothetical protein EYR36_007838 [Pleurotus pulmonarius]